MSIADDIFKDGKLEGEHKIVSHLLQYKFGQLSPELLKHLQALSEDEVLDISARLLDADTIEEVFLKTKH